MKPIVQISLDLTTVDEARRVLAVTLAMEESLATGESVQVAR